MMKRGAFIATLLARAAADCTIDDTTPVTIIAGASHAGADTLHDSLRKALALPDRKRNEVHHFNDVASYGKGNDHYWQSLGCTGDSMVDESPGYLAHSVALLRAASQVPRARWVVLLREPVERALSHFMHLPRKQGGGQGSLKGFMEAVEEERSCIDAALHARAAHGHADISHDDGDALYPRLAARYAFEHCADHLPGGGRQVRAHGSAHFGKEHGLLSLSLYAPQLEHAARMAQKMDLASPLVVVSSKAFHDDAAGTVSSIVEALGLGVGKTSNAAPAFKERRTELDETAVEALDLLFEHPNCALAAVVNNRTLVPHAIGLEHDAAWLPLDMNCNAHGKATHPQPRVDREEL